MSFTHRNCKKIEANDLSMGRLESEENVGEPDNALENEVLVPEEGDEDSDDVNTVDNAVQVDVKNNSRVTPREAITLAVLLFINLLNYMDRYTVAGISVYLWRFKFKCFICTND